MVRVRGGDGRRGGCAGWSVFIGAVLLLADADWSLYWVAAGLVLTVAGSMLDAWVLMVEILR